jgi:hypothetical protein
MRAVCAPVRPLALIFFEYFEYELRTQSAATPDTAIPTIITSM